MEMNTNTTTFQANETYATRSNCDSDTIFAWTVVRRTAKTMTVRDELDGKEKRVGIKTDDQGEWAMPDGRYSMCPVIRSSRTIKTV